MKILAAHERPIYAPRLLTRSNAVLEQDNGHTREEFCLVKSFRNATDIFCSGMLNHSNTRIAT
ncbi:hypothetical protein T01_8191 [Trichinella spiralis]|uniref:Uncharacterized protein n=1 Tax=Trichinella spiralis TaxID=6334 RepID=A0A0V1ASE4_TRISP|nr:hypothetical protein T01_8191 [Trichinella spiralis]